METGIATRHLFTWDREFKYAGRVSCPPGDSFSAVDDIGSSLLGAYFLAGVSRPAMVFWSDGVNEMAAGAALDAGSIKIQLLPKIQVSPTDRVVLCGPIVSDPTKVASFCQRFPANSMSVCALIDELPAFGCLVESLCAKGLERPRRANFFQPNLADLACKYREYEEKMEGDGFGRMAHAVSLGSVVLNEMRHGPGVSPFYGQMLSKLPIFGSNVFIINADCLERFLSPAPLSFREAARCVPVLCPVSQEFCEVTHQKIETAIIFVSGLVVGLDDFLRFFGVMTKQGIVVSGMVKLEDMKGILPVFRYNRVYVPEVGEYRELKHAPHRIL
jgi:hypothetical protein